MASVCMVLVHLSCLCCVRPVGFSVKLLAWNFSVMGCVRVLTVWRTQLKCSLFLQHYCGAYQSRRRNFTQTSIVRANHFHTILGSSGLTTLLPIATRLQHLCEVPEELIKTNMSDSMHICVWINKREYSPPKHSLSMQWLPFLAPYTLTCWWDC